MPENTSEVFTLAHLSDPHLSAPTGVRVRDLLGKRLLGYLSWRLRRRGVHRAEVLAAATRDLAERRPDHVAVTGDLTQIGLPGELREAHDWLQSLGDPTYVTVVPGNHDAYVRRVRGQGGTPFGVWREYMTGDSNGTEPRESSDTGAPRGFPFLRVRGGVALIGVSTAVPTAPFLASGRVGSGQLEALARVLAETRGAGHFRVLLMHHPPAAGVVSRRKGLVDGSELRAVLAREGVELVLHGHLHRACRTELAVPGGSAPVIAVPATSALRSEPDRLARYNLHSVRRVGDNWEVELAVRVYDPQRGQFVQETEEHRTLARPA